MEDFAELSSAAVELFLDADAVWTLQEMIEATRLAEERVERLERAIDEFAPSWQPDSP